MTTPNAPAVQKSQTLEGILTSPKMREQIAMALPSHMTADRVLRVMLTQVRKVPKLLECSQESVLSAFMDCTRMGLEPDGRLAHLIPYGSTCQLIIDYKGLVDLAFRSGLVQSIHADVVCENDTFKYSLGEVQEHSIDFRKGRGKVYAVYARAVLKNGATKCEVLSAEEVDGIKARSRSGKNGPWITDWNEMAKKTAFRRLSKWLPLSPEFRDAVEADHDAPEELKDARAGDAPYLERARVAAEIIAAAPRAEAVDVQDAAAIAAKELAETTKGE